MNQSSIARRARALFDAHRAGASFAPFAGSEALGTLAEAYAVQRAYVALVAAARHTEVAGYKVGLTSPRMQAMCGIDSPIAGVVLGDRLHRDGVTLRRADYGRLGIEFEIAVRLARDLPAVGAPYDFDTVAAAVGAVAPAVEVVDDRAAVYQGLDMATLVADNAWNAGVVTGDWHDRWGDLAAAEAVVELDGVELDRGFGRDVLGHPFHSLAWLANHLALSGDGLRAGQVVATGSIVTTRFPTASERYRYRVEGLGDVSFSVLA